MSKKRYMRTDDICKEYPKDLTDQSFFGLTLDPEQKRFRDAIWSEAYDIIFCDAPAGTGKSLVAVATAYLMYCTNRCDGVVYIVSPTQESKTGYLPGSPEDKIMPYMDPLKDALLKIDINPDTCINQGNINGQKEGTCCISCCSHAYLRGVNFENKVVIIDEAQNMYLDELQKTLTRVNDSCKTIVIGHHKQCDLLKNNDRSGFVLYKEWFSDQERCAICALTVNHRGWVSTHADKIDVRAIYKKLDDKEAAEKAKIEEVAKDEVRNKQIDLPYSPLYTEPYPDKPYYIGDLIPDPNIIT